MSLLAWGKNTFNFNESIIYFKSHHQIAVGGDVSPFRFQVMSPLDCLSNGQGDTKEVSAAERLPYAGPISLLYDDCKDDRARIQSLISWGNTPFDKGQMNLL